jgi:hypothetical protein
MKNKLLNSSILIIILFLGINNILNAQKAPMKFGKVDIADLQMTSYPLDTSAVAVVLCDYGYFDATNFMFTQTLRVKILKKEGLKWADHSYPGYSKSDVRGITYNLENGKIVESKLKSESVFRERVSEDYYRLRVAMPNVKEGSIMDIEFSYKWLPNFWYFQREIPVKWSELILEKSQYIEFRKNYTGFIPLSVSTDTRWVAKDVPAFKPEPYLNSKSNYISKFEFDILRLTIPGDYKEFTTDWDAVNRRLNEHSHFGNALQGALFLNSTAKEIENTYSNPLDKIKAAFEFVKKSVKWNEKESLLASSNVLVTAFNKKIGNSADINLILLQLLKKLDFNAYPVVMSSRDNGMLRPYSPSLEKLNYVITCVKLEDQTILLDATEELMPVGLLPERAINGSGRIIDPKFTDWVEINNTKKNRKLVQGTFSFIGTNVLSGKLIYNNVDYAAFNFRKKYQSYNSEDGYLKHFEKNNTGFEVENLKLTDLDSIYKPVIAEYDIKIKNRVDVLGDLISFNPMLLERIDENPFKLEERLYPVDFGTSMEKIYLYTINLPEGYQVDQLPKPLIIKLPDNSASCIYQISNMNGTVQVMFKFMINKPVFYQTEYSQLRSFYDEVVKKQSELVVLKKI